MWIALGIIAAIIVIVLLLPIHILLQIDEKKDFSLRFRFLWLTFDTDTAFGSFFKKETQAPQADTSTLKERIHTDGLGKTLSDTFGLITRVLKALVKLAGGCSVKKLHIKIRCGGEDAAVAAIHYGQYNALVHGLLNALQGFIKIRKKGCRVDIACDWDGKDLFAFDGDILIRVGQALPVLVKFFWNEMKLKK